MPQRTALPGDGHRPHPTALVLAGGGARGAYEAGVLLYLFEELVQREGLAASFDIYTGTSVGGLNVSFLAAMADRPVAGARELAAYWRSLTMDRVLRFGPGELKQSLSLLTGGRWSLRRLLPGRRRPPAAPHPPVVGLFDTTPLRDDLARRIPWARLRELIRSNRVRGVGLGATEVCTGQSIIFHQSAVADFGQPTHPGREGRAVRLGLEHALASAAIPFLFPSIQIDGVCYMDGALHHNTPLKPALRFGAERVLVVSLAPDPAEGDRRARLSCRRNPFPGALFLLGRVVHAVSAANLDYDLRRVELFNAVLESGTALYGPDFVANLNQTTRSYRQTEYRHVRTCHLRPSRNLNDLAVEAVREAPHELRLPGSSGAALQRVLTSGPLVESELTSYVMFTPSHVRRLLELGWSDARQKRDELVAFFAD